VRYLVGLGNYTARDDAVGVRVVEHIVTQGLERGFAAIDLSTSALDLIAYLNPDTEAVLVVDAARLGLEPGEYRVFTPDVVETQKVTGGLSTHEGDVLKVLDLARDAGYPIPPFAIMGIEPQDMASGLELSERLAERVPVYAAAAIEHLLNM
jgi:hydrogenase maturation protease